MPLRPPALDDRSYSDLLQDMLASIPAHTPEWDAPPQVGDPGRTLLELFAWLADAVLYRANLVPEKQRLAFLKLLGWPLQPANAAQGTVSLSLDPAQTQVLSLAPGAIVSGPPAFETLGGIDVLPVMGQLFKKAKLSTDQIAEAMPVLTGLQALYKLGATPAAYYTQQVFAGNAADPTGIDVLNDTLDHCLWIALLSPDPKNHDAVLNAIGGTNATQRILNIGFVPALPQAVPLSGVGEAAPVKHTWQISATLGPDGNPIFSDLPVFEDTTASLTQPGIVRLGLPQARDIGAPPNDVRSDVQAGVGPKPPRLDDAATQQQLVTWVRLNVSSSVVVKWIGINSVQLDQRTTQQAVILGVSDGSMSQQFALPAQQVEASTFQLEVDMPPNLGYQLWQQTDDLNALPGSVPAYQLDPEAGMVTFGDGLRGMIPPLGRRIRARKMRSGGGSTGNLPPASLSKISAKDPGGAPVTQKVTVSQPLPTSGGSDAEKLDAAERRIPARLRHRDRAVTADDYRSLAEEIPNASIGRVEVLPLFKPQTRTQNVPGVVSVMVIPDKDGFQPFCPRADQPLLLTVFKYLNSRKPTAAELYVIGTDYNDIGISVAVEVLAGFDQRVVSREVEDALRRYLWPLAPGGTLQTGWQLGRKVRSLELEVIVSQVQGVAEVNGLVLFVYQNGKYAAVGKPGAAQQEITLEPYQLPELLQVKVEAGPDGSGVTAPTSLAPDAGPEAGVAVPVVPKVC